MPIFGKYYRLIFFAYFVCASACVYGSASEDPDLAGIGLLTNSNDASFWQWEDPNLFGSEDFFSDSCAASTQSTQEHKGFGEEALNFAGYFHLMAPIIQALQQQKTDLLKVDFSLEDVPVELRPEFGPIPSYLSYSDLVFLLEEKEKAIKDATQQILSLKQLKDEMAPSLAPLLANLEAAPDPGARADLLVPIHQIYQQIGFQTRAHFLDTLQSQKIQRAFLEDQARIMENKLHEASLYIEITHGEILETLRRFPVPGLELPVETLVKVLREYYPQE